ncbi:hypothetical protein [Sulfodiicoccus acidiphilus]|nr:hypothetical protein [Sulfodiicoccus acidiphilus]
MFAVALALKLVWTIIEPQRSADMADDVAAVLIFVAALINRLS